jgi:hypothetical protein
LRRFSADGSRIHVFDKFSGRTFPSRIEDVASQNRFYDTVSEPGLKADKQAPQATEQRLAALEGDAARALDALIQSIEQTGKVDPSTKDSVARLLAAQVFRTLETRTAIVQVQEQMLEALQGEELEPGLAAWLNDSQGLENAALTQGLLLQDEPVLDSVAQALLAHIWTVGINKTGSPLWTSDHPLVRRAYVRHPVLGTSGLASPGIEISFPLNPTLILIMYERTHFHMLTPADGRTFALVPENIPYHNSLQVAQSYRQIYSPAGDFALAELMRREHPDLFTPDRKRGEVA